MDRVGLVKADVLIDGALLPSHLHLIVETCLGCEKPLTFEFFYYYYSLLSLTFQRGCT